eukprot:1451437-Pyramimonas_sp.AAC.1
MTGGGPQPVMATRSTSRKEFGGQLTNLWKIYRSRTACNGGIKGGRTAKRSYRGQHRCTV